MRIQSPFPAAAPAAVEAVQTPGSVADNARKPESLVRTIARNTLRDLETWYPPLVAHNDPRLRAFLSTLFPAAGKAMDLAHQAYEAGKRFAGRAFGLSP